MATACNDAPTAPELPALQASAAPVEIPLFAQFQDYNCGVLTLFTFSGTARVQQQGDRYLLVARGSVTTDTGFSGTFNRQFIIKGDQVAVLRFHDMEVNDATGQRTVFSMGMYLYAAADGIHVVDYELYGGFACVGF
jgi:hypothetical protein